MDENEDLRRRVERTERVAWEQRRAAEEASKREERQGEQYERVLEGLRADVREKDREVANVELRENFKKEELSREVREAKELAKKVAEEAKMAAIAEKRASEEAALLRTEVSTLKGVIEESDRSREQLLRELSRQKDSEQDRLREVDARREAEVKLQERLAQNLMRDKKELEQRIEELVTRLDGVGNKHREQHHATVKYFEAQVAQLKL